MPLAEISVIEGVFSSEQKHQIINGVTEALVKVEGEALRDKTVVIIHEVRSGDWGVGGQTLSTGRVKQVIAGGGRG